MLVGTTDIPIAKLMHVANNPEKLKSFAEQLVPVFFRHIKPIVDNQKYLVAIHLRNECKGNYNAWHDACKELLKGVHITGSISDVYTCADLLAACNVTDIKTFLKKEVQR